MRENSQRRGAMAVSPRRLRRVVETAVLLLVAGLISRTWFLQGVFIPFQVTSGSMAETLLGPHREMVCGDCRRPFLCDTQVAVQRQWAVCPNCGFLENDPEQAMEISGDRLLLDRLAFQLRRPRRWEVVALRVPHQASQIAVKRVVGLPGESVQIRHGDVYVSGEIARKNLAQQRAMAVLVHDANWTPHASSGLPPRWRADAPSTAWSREEGAFRRAETPGRTVIDWMTYHHWERLPGETGRVRPSVVYDQSSYNPRGGSQRECLQPVADLLVSCRLASISGQGRLMLHASDGKDEFLARLDPSSGVCEVERNGSLVQKVAIAGFADGWKDVQVEASLFDRQFLLALNGRVVATVACTAQDEPPAGTVTPISIGTDCLGIELRDVQISRDVYYDLPPLPGPNRGCEEPVELGENEYFVLGDNSPVSEDSRTWPAVQPLDENLLVGKPFVVHLPMRGVDWRAWRFQVPAVGRIRYIR